MNRSDSSNRFDCIAFKEQAQSEVYEEIKDLTPEQQVDYFNKHARNGPLGQWWRKLRPASPTRPVRTTPTGD